MTEPWVVSLLTIVALIALGTLFGVLLSGGSLSRFLLSKQTAWKVATNAEFAAKIEALLNPPPPEPAKPPKPDGTPLRVLTLLQREGRLLDFLLEDVADYSNEDIGASVRDIHSKCQKALQEHLELAPVIKKEEGETVEVKSGFDPSAIQLTGNVTGEPPFNGTLQHHGWRVKAIKLNKPGEGVDEMVIQPAEVELA